MVGSWYRGLEARRWRMRAEKQVAHMHVSRARGLTLLLAMQNDALSNGETARLAKINETIARYLATAADAYVKADAALEACAAAGASLEGVKTLPPPAPVAEKGNAGTPAAPDTAAARGSGILQLYTISGVTLAEAYEYLLQRTAAGQAGPEYMLAVSGVQVGDVLTLERLIEVKMARQSFGEASFDMQDFARIAISLYEHGQYLHAVFHSHRFGGVPGPSATDTRLQTMLEETGYPAIQAVFSEDGYIRFFSNKRRFAVEIYGTGVKPVDGQPHAFRITQFDTLPHPAPVATARGRGDGVRSLPARPGR